MNCIHRYSCVKTSKGKPRQFGFSLVELMVALVLGLIIIGGVINIFTSNQQIFRTNEALGRLQENARISFELMAREIRQAGGNLCGVTRVANVLNNPGSAWSSNWAGGTVRGFDDTQPATNIIATGTTVPGRVADTDAILVLSGGLDNEVRIRDHNPRSAVLHTALGNHGIKAGEILMVCDSGSAAIFQMTGPSSNNPDHIVHNTGKAQPPGNCSKGLGYPPVCESVGNSKNFTGGSVTKLTASTWYVGNNSRGGRSLYRITPNGIDEIAEGVVDMQIDYLLRTETTGTLGSDWVTARAITDWTRSAPQQVVAVRLRLTLNTLASVGTDQRPVVRQLIHVVHLRNRPSS